MDAARVAARIRSVWHRLTVVFLEVVHRVEHERCFRVAGALSFTTLLALVPLATVVFSMLSLFPVFEEWATEAENFIYQNFLPAAGDAIKEYLHQFTDKAGKLTAFGLAFLFISSLLLLATIEDAFNDIFRVHRGRPFMQRILIYWAVLTLGPLLIVTSLSISSYLVSHTILSAQPLVAGAFSHLLKALPWLLTLLAFVFFYNTIPNRTVRFRDALAGGVVATVLFEFAKQAFAYYIVHFNSYQLIYGALATIPIFLVWLYLSWLVVLIGAYVVAVCGGIFEGKPLGFRKHLPPAVQEMQAPGKGGRAA